MNISKAVIPCAGKGTRLNPYSTMMPKELFPLNCYPALYFIIKECIYCKISNICLIVSSEKKVIISQYVKKQFPRIKFQFFTQEVMNGTAKALLLIKK
jgi:dTDP-glucose pyrophosphorylase